MINDRNEYIFRNIYSGRNSKNIVFRTDIS